jgi:hypothetical protein
VKSSEGIFWEARLRGWERTSFYDFPKEIFALRGILRRSGTGLLAYFLGSQGVHDAMLLPEMLFFCLHPSKQYFNHKAAREEILEEIFSLDGQPV